MIHEISKYVYAILEQGQVIIATLDNEDDQNRMDRRPIVTQLVTEHKYPATMVFPATPANYEALQILYGGMTVPSIPLEPNDIVRELLTHRQTCVIIKHSNYSYEDARGSEHAQVRVIWACSHTKSGLSESSPYMVPYDVFGNEITSLDCVKGKSDEK